MEPTHDVKKVIVSAFFEAYEIDTKSHDTIIPGDVVKIDVRPELSRLEQTLRQIKTATYGQIEYDDMTQEVSFNDQPQSQNASADASADGTADAQNASKPPSIDNPSGKAPEQQTLDFLKLLKQNGALDQLKNLDMGTKSKIASEVLNLIKNTPQQPTASGTGDVPPSPEEQKELEQNITASQQVAQIHPDEAKSIKDFAEKNAKKFSSDQEFFDNYVKSKGGNIDTSNEKYVNSIKNAWHALNDKKYINIQEDILLMKEAMIYLFEAGTTSPSGAALTPPSATTAAPSAATPAPSAAAKPPVKKKSANALKSKFLDVQKAPDKFGINPSDKEFVAKKKFVDDKINSYTTLKKIPGALHMELMGLVKNVDSTKGEVEFELLQKTATGKNDKSDYNETGQKFTVPLKSVKSKIEGAGKKKGILGKMGDWLTR
jgi:hypothetical protein